MKRLHCAAYTSKRKLKYTYRYEKLVSVWRCLTLHDIYGHQAHSGGQKHVARCVHCNGPTNTMTNQDDWGRRLAVAGLNHVGYITEKSGILLKSLISIKFSFGDV